MAQKIFLTLGHAILTLPMIWSIFYVYKNQDEEFFKYLLHFFGLTAISLLIIISLLSFFLRRTKWIQKILRILGVYTLFYTTAHLLIYLLTEIFWKDFLSEIFLRAYLLYGFLAFLGISLLASISLISQKVFSKISSLSFVVTLLAAIHMMLGTKIPSPTSYIFFAIFLALICNKLLKKKK